MLYPVCLLAVVGTIESRFTPSADFEARLRGLCCGLFAPIALTCHLEDLGCGVRLLLVSSFDFVDKRARRPDSRMSNNRGSQRGCRVPSIMLSDRMRVGAHCSKSSAPSTPQMPFPFLPTDQKKNKQVRKTAPSFPQNAFRLSLLVDTQVNSNTHSEHSMLSSMYISCQRIHDGHKLRDDNILHSKLKVLQ